MKESEKARLTLGRKTMQRVIETARIMKAEVMR